MKILVTGANGYLGSGIVKSLLDKGVDVIAVDFDDAYIDKRATIIKADIFSLENPFEELLKPDCILHLAWKDGFAHFSSAHINELPHHTNFLYRMIEGGVKQVSVLGSMHEIGFYEGCIDENTPCNPLSPYGIAKNALRRLIQIKCREKNICFKWLRGFYIVGSSVNGCSIFSKLIQASNSGKTTFPFTSGKNEYDFLDYDVFCDYVARTVIQDKVNGIINICSGEHISLANRVERFITENDLNIKLQYGVYPDRPYDSKCIWGDNKLLMQIINYEK